MKALVHDLTGQYIAFFNDVVTYQNVQDWVLNQCFEDTKGTQSRFLDNSMADIISVKVNINYDEKGTYIEITADQEIIRLNIVDIIPVI